MRCRPRAVQPDASIGLTLAPLEHGDSERVRRWLLDPNVQQWWGNAASAEAEISLARASDAAICRLIRLGGAAIGYAQAVEYGQATTTRKTPVPAGSWECRIFIGAMPQRGKGYGQQALDHLAREVFASTLAIACVIPVSIRNERAARAYEAIGFRWIAITDDPVHGPSWVMLRDRPRR